MNGTEYILVGFGVLLASLTCVRLADRLDAWRLTRCFRVFPTFACPNCRKALGNIAATAATQKIIKFTGSGRRRLRGRDYPSRLVTIVCPYCSAELEFRLDGSLFSCNHEVVA
jgi:hypothetical protein